MFLQCRTFIVKSVLTMSGNLALLSTVINLCGHLARGQCWIFITSVMAHFRWSNGMSFVCPYANSTQPLDRTLQEINLLLHIPCLRKESMNDVIYVRSSMFEKIQRWSISKRMFDRLHRVNMGLLCRSNFRVFPFDWPRCMMTVSLNFDRGQL